VYKEGKNMENEVEETNTVEHIHTEVPQQLCGFRIGNDYYAVSILDVQEVIRPQQVTNIPLAAQHLQGLINLRGQIVTAVNLKKLFGLDEDYDEDYMNVIVKHNSSLFALVVDEILDILNVDQDEFEETPETLRESLRSFVRGVFKLDAKLIILLDLEKIIAHS